MHGGALMSLADTAGALVAFLGLPDGATTATITSTTQLLRPVTGGTVRAVAVPLHRGRTVVTAQTSLYDDTRAWLRSRRPLQGAGGPPAPPSEVAQAGTVVFCSTQQVLTRYHQMIDTENMVLLELPLKAQSVAKLRYRFDCNQALVA